MLFEHWTADFLWLYSHHTNGLHLKAFAFTTLHFCASNAIQLNRQRCFSRPLSLGDSKPQKLLSLPTRTLQHFCYLVEWNSSKITTLSIFCYFNIISAWSLAIQLQEPTHSAFNYSGTWTRQNLEGQSSISSVCWQKAFQKIHEGKATQEFGF